MSGISAHYDSLILFDKIEHFLIVSSSRFQMVWEQGSVVIVNMCKLTENDVSRHRYWPEEGSALYHIYEVHLVSEHVWCEDYLVRSFYLKNLEVMTKIGYL